jgi:heat shock protein HslJ
MTSRPAADAAVSLLLVVVLAACATAPIPSASAAPTLGDTAWTVMTVGGSGTLVDARPTMAFGADGQVTGTSGCNSYGGPYTLDGDAIQVGELASTLILCEGDRGSQEMAFMAALRGVQTWRITEPRELHLAGLSEIVAQPAIDGPSGSPPTRAWSVAGTSPRWARQPTSLTCSPRSSSPRTDKCRDPQPATPSAAPTPPTARRSPSAGWRRRRSVVSGRQARWKPSTSRRCRVSRPGPSNPMVGYSSMAPFRCATRVIDRGRPRQPSTIVRRRVAPVSKRVVGWTCTRGS